MAKYGRGLICLALDSAQAKKLNLSLMSPINQSRNKTAFTVSIEEELTLPISLPTEVDLSLSRLANDNIKFLIRL